MTRAMTAFGIAVGGTSLICYVPMTRLQNSQRNRRSSGDRSATDGSNYAGGDSWTISHLVWRRRFRMRQLGQSRRRSGGDSGGGGDGGGD
jgi:hypothetical protein